MHSNPAIFCSTARHDHYDAHDHDGAYRRVESDLRWIDLARSIWTRTPLAFRVELEQDSGGRWLAEVVELSCGFAYGATGEEALPKALALALRVIADRLVYGEHAPALNHFVVAC